MAPPENLSKSLPESLKSIRTRHLFAMRLDVQPMIVIGATPGGFKRVAVINGGTFEGERLSGAVLEGGSDWQTLRSDGAVLLDVRLNLKSSDGELINMTYQGIRAGSVETLKRIDAGEAVDPTEYYFRSSPTFETASAKYGWLNSILAIGTGFRGPKGVVYNIFEVL